MLGALTVAPMSGYDLKRFFEESVSFFWAESYGQIYPILKQLRSEGLVTATGAGAAARGTRGAGQAAPSQRRTVYSITPGGRRVLAAWLGEPAEHQVGRIEVLLKLFFARQGEPGGAAGLIDDFRAHHEARLTTYAATEARLRGEHADRPDAPYWLLALSYGQHVSRALLAWCDEADARVRTAGERPRADA